MRLFLPLILCAAAAAQDTAGWIQGASGRFRLLHSPVVSVYAFASLASRVCAVDPAAARELYRTALQDLNSLTPDNLRWTGQRLPVGSITGLSKLAIPGALRCAPDLQGTVDSDRLKAQTDEERRGANLLLSSARTQVSANPDRAVQMALGALSAATPATLDIDTLSRFLSELRDRSAELSDEVFPTALEFITSDPQPGTSFLMSLGNYLFTAPKYLETSDKQEAIDTFTAGNSTISDFTVARRSANPDDVRDYIESGLKVLTAFDSPNYDPVAAYAIAWQVLPKAKELAPELADELQKALDRISLTAKSSAVAQVLARTGGALPNPNGDSAAVARSRAVARSLDAAASERFIEARNLLRNIDDAPARGQASSLVDFAEAAYFIARQDLPWASTLAGGLRPGVKRAMLCTSMASAAPTRIQALSEFDFAMRDIRLLPAEQQMFSWANAAAALATVDPDGAFLAISQLVEASNDALVNPRKGRFDPGVLRRIDSKGAETITDSALILFTRRGLREVVDTGGARRSFTLRAPGPAAFTLPAAIRLMGKADLTRLESIVLSLRDETQMVDALNAIAELRLKPSPPAAGVR